MRDIKFRAKIRYNGQHRFSGEWVYGYYWYDENTKKHYIKESDDVDGMGTYEHQDFEIFIETLEQYTGLKDKNGVEIYEGDILESEDCHAPIPFKRKLEVCYSVFGCGFNVNQQQQNSIRWSVIGNIHQNPELKEEG